MTETVQQNSVRPNDKTPRRLLAAILARLRRYARGDRFDNLYQAIVVAIHNIDALKQRPITLLDYGCGTMPFSQRLQQEGIVHSFIGMDIYTPPATQTGEDTAHWARYRKIPEEGISALAETFDLALVIDVLHHADEADRPNILANLAAKCGYVLVKDHFEYGQLSRQLLRLADWFGNYAYGVNVPKRYFDPSSWQALVTQAGLKQVSLTPNVRVHDGVFGLILPPRCHFISLLVR